MNKERKNVLLVHEDEYGRKDFAECSETEKSYMYCGSRISKEKMTLWGDTYRLATKEEFDEHCIHERNEKAKELNRSLENITDNFERLSHMVNNSPAFSVYVSIDKERLTNDITELICDLKELVEDLKK